MSPAEGINPFVSQVVDEEVPVPRVPMSRLVMSSLLLFIGGMSLLLLNGQVFTNSLVFLGLCMLSGLIWLPLAVRRRPWHLLGCCVVAVHVAILLGVLCYLPSAYKFERAFDAKMEQIRAKSPRLPQAD